MRRFFVCVVLASTLAGCGAKVVFDGEAGGGPAGQGGEGTGAGQVAGTGGSVSTGMSCNDLWSAYQVAISDAAACDPFVNMVQCDGSAVSPDACGCYNVLLNEESASKVAATSAAYDAWQNADCGPIDCTVCDPITTNGYCASNGVCTRL